MDPQKLKAAYQKLEALDDRLTHKVRPRAGGGYSRPGVDLIEERLRHLAEYTVELRQVVHDLFVAIASKPGAPDPQGGESED